LRQNAFGQAEARADARGLALGDIAAQRGEPLLQLAVAAYRAITVGLIDDLGHPRLLLLEIGEQRVEAARRQHPFPCQHVEVALFGILWEIADFTTAHHGAGIRLRLACEDSHGCGLARAVAPYQADAITWLDPQRRPRRG
jgi:hypothetical protein